MEALIPRDDLPDTLSVYQHGSVHPTQYKRVLPHYSKHGRPSFTPSQGVGMRPRSSAILNLPDPDTFVFSAHSTVARSAFTFRGECGRVVAKYPHPTCGAHRRSHHEGVVYHHFPSHLADHTPTPLDDVATNPPRVIPSGVGPKKGGKIKKVCRAIARAVKEAATASTLEAPPPRDACDRMGPRMVVVPPVVPKFFGYYIPAGVESLAGHPACGPEGRCATQWPAPIILMEDCGSPIELATMPEHPRYVLSLSLVSTVSL